ncbi:MULTISPECIES: hypothetical protein [unclassified Polaribacter]|uniref:hypothetical protein n=1 Tax=unclassified Polaribacter TaxID=196858 RepID=UPI0011BE8D11|nr:MULTISPECIES: hypothetical protein [unclassified Polaribacter]TXD54123.1 hypothetical protein ES043_01100 [Polaribacter sp. IC063]TXD62388.1 hypothetical protein ES044_01310 [Polaribacter sp. IC066]
MQKLNSKFIFKSLILIVSGTLCCFSLMIFPFLILEQNDNATQTLGYYYFGIFIVTSFVLYFMTTKYVKNNVA